MSKKDEINALIKPFIIDNKINLTVKELSEKIGIDKNVLSTYLYHSDVKVLKRKEKHLRELGSHYDHETNSVNLTSKEISLLIGLSVPSTRKFLNDNKIKYLKGRK